MCMHTYTPSFLGVLLRLRFLQGSDSRHGRETGLHRLPGLRRLQWPGVRLQGEAASWRGLNGRIQKLGLLLYYMPLERVRYVHLYRECIRKPTASFSTLPFSFTILFSRVLSMLPSRGTVLPHNDNVPPCRSYKCTYCTPIF